MLEADESVPLYSAQIEDHFGGQIDLIMDPGEYEFMGQTTIVDFISGIPEVIRHGIGRRVCLSRKLCGAKPSACRDGGLSGMLPDDVALEATRNPRHPGQHHVIGRHHHFHRYSGGSSDCHDGKRHPPSQ